MRLVRDEILQRDVTVIQALKPALFIYCDVRIERINRSLKYESRFSNLRTNERIESNQIELNCVMYAYRTRHPREPKPAGDAELQNSYCVMLQFCGVFGLFFLLTHRDEAF